MGDKVAILKEVTGTPYTRPSDWLSLPDIPEGTEKISMLVAIFDNQTNFVAVLVQGSYTINWGDGSAPEDIPVSIQHAQHNYNYSDLGAETYCSRGYRQAIITITPQGGHNLTLARFDERHSGELYYASTPILYMKIRAPEMTVMQLHSGNTRHSQMMEEFEWQGTSKLSTPSSMFYCCFNLVKCKIVLSSAATDLSSCFRSCYSLRELDLTGLTSAVTTTAAMFNECNSITTVPLFDTSNVVSAGYMFGGCFSLREIPEFNFSNCTDFSYLFYNCFSLIRTGTIDISKATTTLYMFGSCSSLLTGNAHAIASPNLTVTQRMFAGCSSMRRVNLFDTSHATDISWMFGGCSSLREVPAFDFSSVVNATSVFSYNYALQKCPDLSLPVATNTSYMFQVCFSLSTYPVRDLPLATNCSWMYYGDYAAKDSRDFYLPAATDLSYMFYLNYGNSIFGAFTLNAVGNIDATSMFGSDVTIKKMEPLNATKLSTVTNMISNCYSLSIAVFNDLQVNFSIAGCNFGRDELVDIFNGLKDLTGGSSQTLTITNNWGVSSLSDEDKAIATNKNWTLVL